MYVDPIMHDLKSGGWQTIERNVLWCNEHSRVIFQDFYEQFR